MLKNLKVGSRLAFGFTVVTVLLAVIAVLSVVRLGNLNDSLHLLVNDRFPKVLEVTDAIDHVNVVARAVRNMMLLEDAAAIDKETDRVRSSGASIDGIISSLEASITTPEGKRLLASTVASRTAYKKTQDRILELIHADQRKPAVDLLLGEYRDQQTKYMDDLAGLKKYQVALAEAASNEAESLTQQSVIVILVIGGAAVLLALLLALLITRSILKPLNSCIVAANRIAEGDLEVSLDETGKDELAALQRSMGVMSRTLKDLIVQMNRMSSEHDAGDIDVRIDESRFKAAFKEMAEGVNTMVFGHIAVKKKAMACVEEFGKGNFEAPLERFPGKKAFINDTIEKVRVNLKALIADADMLAQAAVEGRLTTRADATRHQGDFRKIVEGVNKTLDLVIDPINETTAILKRMADGDLTTTMTGAYRGDFDILKTALNGTIDSINDILGQVSMAVEQVNAGSQQVSQASQSLSQGATEQASSLEEITSSVTEIAGQTRQNTENAVQVNTLAKTARNDAEQGNTQMADLVSAMSDINESAEEIRKIVKAIDDISFQINLLALNANVEAARAGKYGKGFAVVAEEVRNLAVRSAGSVKETTKMVDEAIANIGRGNELVDVTAKQLASIVDGAAKVAGLAEEVSTASREQSQGLEQISTGLNQIDQVTQANTASAEESASAAEELSSQAQQLKAMVARFKLKERERGRMSEAEMLAMLRAEMARSGGSTAKSPARALTLHKDDQVGKGAAKAPAKTRAARLW